MPDAAVEKVLTAALKWAAMKRCQVDTAVLIGCLPHNVGLSYSSVSNGNEVWAIIRSGRVVTLMLRRSVQPATPAALGVREVIA